MTKTGIAQSRLYFIEDKSTRLRFLLDISAEINVISHRGAPNSLPASGSNMSTYGQQLFHLILVSDDRFPGFLLLQSLSDR